MFLNVVQSDFLHENILGFESLVTVKAIPGGTMPHSQGLSNIPILSPNNQIAHSDAYLFKVNSNIVLPSAPKPS